MNKRELFEKISDLEEITIHVPTNINLAEVNYLRKPEVLELIEQLDEPKKPVIPQFVADWIESELHSYSTLSEAIDNMDDDNQILDWFYYNSELFARAWLNGYEVEKEKLYTVKIAEATLTKITRGSNVRYKMLPFGDISDVFDKAIYTTRLTEQEIKQKDERLWQWAKEVVE